MEDAKSGCYKRPAAASGGRRKRPAAAEGAAPPMKAALKKRPSAAGGGDAGSNDGARPAGGGRKWKVFKRSCADGRIYWTWQRLSDDKKFYSRKQASIHGFRE